MSADGRYYSQNEEERVLLEIFDGAPGRFLDIGAFYPKLLSNTRALYERGWRGVMVEVTPHAVRALVKEYGKVLGMSVICAAVVPESWHTEFSSRWSGLLSMTVTDDAISSSVPSVIKIWEPVAKYYGTLLIGTVTMWQLLKLGPYDFVNIDTEGSSVVLFRDLLMSGARPRCICVEDDDHVASTRMLGEHHGYKLVYASNENLIWCTDQT